MLRRNTQPRAFLSIVTLQSYKSQSHVKNCFNHRRQQRHRTRNGAPVGARSRLHGSHRRARPSARNRSRRRTEKRRFGRATFCCSTRPMPLRLNAREPKSKPKFGRLDVLINNAGVASERGRLCDDSEPGFERSATRNFRDQRFRLARSHARFLAAFGKIGGGASGECIVAVWAVSTLHVSGAAGRL